MLYHHYIHILILKVNDQLQYCNDGRPCQEGGPKESLRCGSVHREITSFAITILLKHLDYSILFSIFATSYIWNMPLLINAMNMEIKVVIKKRAPKPKTPRGITRAAFAMALLFFALCQWQNKVYFDGNHSSGVVVAMIVFGSLSGLFFLLFFCLLVSKFGN